MGAWLLGRGNQAVQLSGRCLFLGHRRFRSDLGLHRLVLAGLVSWAGYGLVLAGVVTGMLDRLVLA